MWPTLILNLVLFSIGLTALIWGANRFIDNSAALAKLMKLSSLLIGIFIIGLGTSTPELLVSVMASWQGSDVALGNAIGSNIANIALILGTTAILVPIAFKSSILRTELPILTGITAITLFFFSDFLLTRIEALILVLLFVLFLIYSIKKAQKIPDDIYLQEQEKNYQSMEPLNPQPSIPKILFGIILGLLVMLGSSQLLIHSSTAIAKLFNISEIIIGLTIVAIGTSLPELASSIAAIKKNEHDLAVGNVIGSNIFNTLVVVGCSGMIKTITIDRTIFYRDCLTMLLLTLSLFLFGYRFRRPEGQINRLEGIILVFFYVTYTIFIANSLVASS